MTTDALVSARTVSDALQRAAATPHGITLIDKGLNERPLPYGDLADASARAAAALRSKGVEAGDRVCLLGPTTPELLVALFGTWWAGAVPVVMPLPRRIAELDVFVADAVARVEAADASLVLVADLVLQMAPPLDVATPIRSLESFTSDLPTPVAPIDTDSSDLAYLQFTSGTTAASRAVALTHDNLVTNMLAAGQMLGIDGERDVLVSWLPLFHDMGLIGLLFGSVLWRAPLVLQPTEEFLSRPGSWLDAISRFRGTVTASPNFGYGLAARELEARPRPLDLSTWRIAANGAEAVDIETTSAFAAATERYGFRPDAMCPMYGLAESTLAVSLTKPDRPLHVEWVDRDRLETSGTIRWTKPGAPGARAFVSCGHAVPGSEVRVVDDGGQPLPAGRVGEVCVRGPSVMAGYWRNDERTNDAVQDGWLHTGDLGFWGTDGLVICGRAKDMIILGGRNLYPEDYEFWTERVPGVRRGNVIAFAVPAHERMVVVAETTANAEEADGVARQALITLQQQLPRGPEEVVLVAPGTLPKTSSGKRQRRACRDRYDAGELDPLAVAHAR